jgi:hypothetical protein
MLDRENKEKLGCNFAVEYMLCGDHCTRAIDFENTGGHAIALLCMQCDLARIVTTQIKSHGQYTIRNGG